MKMIKLTLVTFVMVASQLSIFNATAADEAVAEHKISVSGEAGTLGVGASLSWRFTDRFALRGGVNFLSLSADGEDIAGITYDSADAQLLNAPVALDFYPLKDRTFRISAGLLFNQNELEGSVPAGSTPGQKFITIGATPNYDPFNLGGLNLEVDAEPIAPFISIGASIYLDNGKCWSLGGEIGVAYMGSPEAVLTTGIAQNPLVQADLAQEESEIEDDLDSYKFYPIVKVSVTYSF